MYCFLICANFAIAMEKQMSYMDFKDLANVKIGARLRQIAVLILAILIAMLISWLQHS